MDETTRVCIQLRALAARPRPQAGCRLAARLGLLYHRARDPGQFGVARPLEVTLVWGDVDALHWETTAPTRAVPRVHLRLREPPSGASRTAHAVSTVAP